ncbi:unnamed protein product, partial [Mesorhabditis spiculigera]
MWGGDKCCRGVDLNRNFDHHWAETGSSYEPCSNLYHGDYVFSEPEASSVRKFLETEEMWGKTDAFLTLHTYAQLWIYPFSHQEVTYPKDIDELKRTARRAVSRLENVYGTVYRMGTGADTLAPASGGSDDWAKSKMHVKFVYLIELRPEEHLSHGFILHKKELIPTGIETLEGLKEVFESVLASNNIKRDPFAKISPAMRRKQDLRRRVFLQQTEAPTSPATTTATTSGPPTTVTTSTVPSTTSITTTDATTRSTNFRPTAPMAPPTFGGVTTTEKPKTKSPEEIEKLRREQIAKKRELEARKREPLVVEYAITVRYRIEETRRRVKELERRRAVEKEEDERRAEERTREDKRRRERERRLEEEKEQEARRRMSIQQRQQDQWRRDNERRLEQIRLREAEDRRKEEQRVAEEERQKEVAKLAELEKKKAEEELEKEKLKAIEPIVRVARKLVDGRIEEKEVEVLEAQSDTGRSDASLVTVAVIELPPKSSTAAYTTYSPLRIPPNAVTQSYTSSRDQPFPDMPEVRIIPGQLPAHTKSTYPPPRITQRTDDRYTTTVPIAFRDPSCRDLRYSCSFWLKNSPEVCVTQRSFMRAQCAYTCRFLPAGRRGDHGFVMGNDVL